MAISLRRAETLTSAITDAFAGIGSTADTKAPKGKGNTEAVAYEYFVASLLSKVAEARKNKSEREAVQAGLLFDPKKGARPSGTHEVLHEGEAVRIILDVGPASARLDVEAFVDLLEKAGLARAKIDKARKTATGAGRPPHRFQASLATV